MATERPDPRHSDPPGNRPPNMSPLSPQPGQRNRSWPRETENQSKIQNPKSKIQPPGAMAANNYTPPIVPGGSPVAQVLASAIGRMESAPKIRESLALAWWPRVVGAQAAAATEVECTRDGILFVRTKSSVWSHEL